MDIQAQLQSLPNSPGVYQYFNAKDEIIYVGKAKNLKKRVLSYFNKIHESPRTNVLVKNIAYLKYIVVPTEADALLLENNLIKKLQPRYNVLLKDDKTYPSICISNEEFPRVFKLRQLIRNGSKYYGPYSSVYALNYLLEVVHKVFPIRTCKFPMSAEGIARGKYKICLKYHLHLCSGVCEGKESKENYQAYIAHIREIIKGNAVEIQKKILTEINRCAAQLNFETAHLLKQKYDLLDKFVANTVVANTVMESTDIFGFDQNENSAFVSILRVEKGAVVQGMTMEYRQLIDEPKEELLALAIVNLREKLHSKSREIVVPFEVDFPIKDVKITVPLRGDRHKLLDLAQQNVRQYKLEQMRVAEKLNPEQRGMKLMKEIQEKLHLPALPITIEIFDNSNISGCDAVAACVVYQKGKPSKKDYRKYTVKTVEGADDYGTMREIVHRRYSRLLAENQPLPHLIVADGGVGQMNAIQQVVADELHLQIPIAGLAKNEKHRTRELLIGSPPQTIGLKPTDMLFKFFAAMQDEVHRFAISFHRAKRSKTQVRSELDAIKGIGTKTKNTLLAHFKSVKRLKEAIETEHDPSLLETLIGKQRASIICEYFTQPPTPNL